MQAYWPMRGKTVFIGDMMVYVKTKNKNLSNLPEEIPELQSENQYTNIPINVPESKNIFLHTSNEQPEAKI